jgi:U3 small nucleolar RNA-associated protein 22
MIVGCGEDDFSHSNCYIRVLIAVPSTTFPATKTLPWKNCLRHTEPVGTQSLTTQNATPIYNATIRAESAVTSYLSLLHNSGKRSKEFLSACKLGRVWLRQRGYETTVSKGGYGGFEVSCLLALLQQGGGPKGRPLLSPGYSGYQLFKVLLQFLASTDLVKSPLVIGQTDTEGVEKLVSSTPTLFDAARGLNVLWKMTAWSYTKVRHPGGIQRQV